MRFAIRLILGFLILTTTTAAMAGSGSASVDDTAKFLSGQPVSADSPLLPLTRQSSWQGYARFVDGAWKTLDRTQISKVRDWSAQNLTQTKPVLFYIFSGPDFLYADAFFPNATTYVLAGLEPVGQIPDVLALPSGSVSSELNAVQSSLSNLLRYSFFITKNMRVQFASHRLTGIIPPLYVFMARAGKTVQEVSLVNVDKDGLAHAATEEGVTSTAKGVKIVFAGADKVQRTLYYFQTDVSNDGARKSGFLTFCEKLGNGDAFIKSASFLLHSGNFSTVRDFLLKQASTIVQDDSGVPVRYFKDGEWDLKPYGRYLGPIAIFSANYQSALNEIFRKARPGPLPFGMGYRIRAPESHLLVAVKKAMQATAVPKE